MPITHRMHTMIVMLVLSCLSPALAAGADMVGNVERARNEVSARPSAADPSRPLAAGNPVYQNEMVLTGQAARAELRLSGGASLVLGEKSEVRLDEFIFDKNGSATINLVTGALRYISGIKGHAGKLTIKTAVATIGVRGTDFWVGPIDGVYGVLLLNGNVEVSNAGGRVTLDTPRTGTLIMGSDVAPGAAVPWPDDRRVRALSQTDF